MTIKIPLSFYLFILPGMLMAQVSKTMKHVPDTGQSSGFTNTFGEDNDYGMYSPGYHLFSDHTVIDTITGLMWQQNDGGEMTIDQARIYCDTLTLGNYSNWRLPNAKEAYSILNHQNLNPSIDTTLFTKTLADYWWTSDRQWNDTNKIWCTNAGGGVGNHPRTETISAGGSKRFHVRAVRDLNAPISYPQQFYVQNSIVTDSLHGLSWQATISSDSISWEEALQYAESSNYGGFNDWRLPNIKELQTLTQVDLSNPCLSASLFNGISVAPFWSSTTLINQSGKAWIMDSKFGITTYKDKLQKAKVLVVRTSGEFNTGVSTIKESTIQCYPNPFNSYIQCEPSIGFEEVILTNVMGKIVYQGKNIEQQNLSFLAAGIYILSIPSKRYQLAICKE